MTDVVPNEMPEHEQVAPQQDKLSLGAQLAAQREARAWSIEYVAGQLNLAARQISALEQENYAALPGMASVRGFVRAYAKLLKVDADPLVALIAAEQIAPNLPLEPRPKLSSAPFSDSRLSGVGQRNNPVKGILIAIVFVLLALAIVGVEHFGGWPTLSESLSTQFKELSSGSATQGDNHDQGADSNIAVKPIQDTAEIPVKESATPVAAPVVAPPVSTAAPAKSAEANAQSPSGTSPAPALSTNAVAPTAVPPAAAPSAPAIAAVPKAKPEAISPVKPESISQAKAETPKQATGGQKKLQLTARENSWIEVREGNNVVVSRLLKAGESESLDVAGGASLVIGNAAGVDVTFAGQQVSTKTDPKSNVGRISLK